MTTVSVLGSTGSIGTQTLEVVRSEPDRFRISALAAWSSVEALIAQVREFRPDIAAIGQPELAGQLKAGIPSDIEVLAGDGSFQELATRGEVVVNGVVGFAGLGVTLAALGSGRRLALANKESL
ncbi:MAG: 1-deoxy-D-xylulose-5-phosphate reductoisomerase, partial [Actinomycetota bacterium]|nr:1-deoxy-D-xylulose-5-phosphate reductoisomerase [Actinomycetota bacterium]